MEKFTPEIKAEIIDDINRMKKKLDKITEEINSLSEDACGIEFAPIVMDVNRTMSDMEALKIVLKDWADENDVEQNVFGE